MMLITIDGFEYTLDEVEEMYQMDLLTSGTTREELDEEIYRSEHDMPYKVFDYVEGLKDYITDHQN